MSHINFPQKTTHPFFVGILALACSIIPLTSLAQGIDVLSERIEMTVPKSATPALMRATTQSMTVVIDGRSEILAPGAQIRDTQRRLVFPGQLINLIGSGEVKVAIEREFSGQLLRIWMLEKAVR